MVAILSSDCILPDEALTWLWVDKTESWALHFILKPQASMLDEPIVQDSCRIVQEWAVLVHDSVNLVHSLSQLLYVVWKPGK